MNPTARNTTIAIAIALLLGAWMWWTTGALTIPFGVEASDASVATTTGQADQ